jgi:hypothetical protein
MKFGCSQRRDPLKEAGSPWVFGGERKEKAGKGGGRGNPAEAPFLYHGVKERRNKNLVLSRPDTLKTLSDRARVAVFDR